MAYTRADLRNEVLEHLGVLAAGETASAEDAASVERRIDSVHAMLQTKGIAYWDLSAIPDDAFLLVARIVAHHCSHAFGKNEATRLEMRVDAVEAELTLCALTAADPVSGEPIKSEYF